MERRAERRGPTVLVGFPRFALGSSNAVVSLILDTLRRRRLPLDALPRSRHQAADIVAAPAESDARGPVWPLGHLVIYVLFLVILGVSGWVLIEWLLARAPESQPRNSAPSPTSSVLARASAARPEAPASQEFGLDRRGSSSHYNLALP